MQTSPRPPTTVLCALALTLCLPTLAAAQGWKRVNDDDGITVLSKRIKGSELIAFKGVAMVNAPPAKVFAVLADNSRRTEWVDRLGQSKVLQRIAPFDVILYQVFKAPLMISDRDYVYRATATQDARGHLLLKLRSVEHKQAPETIGVRATLMNSSYRLIPVGRYRTRVIVEIHTNPKGMLPTSIVNYVQKSWPVKTLQGIRVQVKRKGLKLVPLPPKPKPSAKTEGPNAKAKPAKAKLEGAKANAKGIKEKAKPAKAKTDPKAERVGSSAEGP